jgi:aminoglycoside phosphotransferase (APT) family kinase protein
MTEDVDLTQQVRADGLSLGRDLGTVRLQLHTWLQKKMPDVTGLQLSDFRVPLGSGSASETLLFDATYARDAETTTTSLVARIKPTTLGHHYQDHFEDEYRILELLGKRSNVPVPHTFWYERDKSVIGEEFCVLEQVQGQVPPDNPPFNTAGFVVEATPDQRRKLWESAVRTLCRIHTADLGDLSFLRSENAPSGLRFELEQSHRANEWAVDGPLDPIVEQAAKYLDHNLPEDAIEGLSWGDARIGNMMFRDFECVAVLDWDMASLGGPLVDLGFWMFMEQSWPEPKLDGLGGRDETLRIWAEETSITAESVHWYEVFAGYRLCAALISHDRKMRANGVVRTDYRTPKERIAVGDSGTPNYEDQANPRRMIEALASYL